MNRAISFVVALVLCAPSLANEGPADGSPPELQHFAALIGNWSTTEESMKPDGSGWVPSKTADWNFYWSFAGRGIRDDYISPPMSEAVDDESKRVFGTNLRIFNPDTKQWVMTWLTPGSSEPGNFTATSTDEKIVMLSVKPNAQGFYSRVTFSNMTGDSFDWQLEWSADKENWTAVHRIYGKRKN